MTTPASIRRRGLWAIGLSLAIYVAALAAMVSGVQPSPASSGAAAVAPLAPSTSISNPPLDSSDDPSDDDSDSPDTEEPCLSASAVPAEEPPPAHLLESSPTASLDAWQIAPEFRGPPRPSC